jgi:hypothetical protein
MRAYYHYYILLVWTFGVSLFSGSGRIATRVSPFEIINDGISQAGMPKTVFASDITLFYYVRYLGRDALQPRLHELQVSDGDSINIIISEFCDDLGFQTTTTGTTTTVSSAKPPPQHADNTNSSPETKASIRAQLLQLQPDEDTIDADESYHCRVSLRDKLSHLVYGVSYTPTRSDKSTASSSFISSIINGTSSCSASPTESRLSKPSQKSDFIATKLDFLRTLALRQSCKSYLQLGSCPLTNDDVNKKKQDDGHTTIDNSKSNHKGSGDTDSVGGRNKRRITSDKKPKSHIYRPSVYDMFSMITPVRLCVPTYASTSSSTSTPPTSASQTTFTAEAPSPHDYFFAANDGNEKSGKLAFDLVLIDGVEDENESERRRDVGGSSRSSRGADVVSKKSTWVSITLMILSF